MAGGMHGWGACVAAGACVARGVCMTGSMQGQGVCGWGGIHGQGACVAGGHAWWGECMVGVYVAGGHEYEWQGVYMAGGMRDMHAPMRDMHAPPPTRQILRLRHTVNERVVRILLECNLVLKRKAIHVVNTFYLSIRKCQNSGT